MVSKIIRADGVTELASVKSVTYHESVNADTDLRPGCVASSYIEVTCFGAQSDAPDVGEALTYYQVVGEIETLIGIFYAEPSIPTKNSYKFVAYDAVHKLDADFSSWLSAHQNDFPYTVKQLVEQACTIAGVTLGTSSWDHSTMSVNAWYADGLTCRNILQYAAEIACKFVRCNTDGEIVFDWYKGAASGETKTASGTIATFDDGADRVPLKKLTAQIEPVQDLHGYDSPWPAGGGQNLFPLPTTAETKNGVTVEATSSGEIWVHGTPTIASGYLIFTMPPVSQSIIGQTATISVNEKIAGIGISGGASGGGLNISMSDTVTSRTALYSSVANDPAINVRYDIGTIDKKFKIQLEIGSSATTFAPYSNICPISGWTGLEGQRTGKNLIPTKLYSGGSYNVNIGTVFNFTESAKQFTDEGSGVFYINTTATWEGYTMLASIGKASNVCFKTVLNSTGQNGFTAYLLDENFVVLEKVIGNSVPVTCLWPIDLANYPTAKYFAFFFTNRGTATATLTITEPQLELGLTASDYTTYSGDTYSVSWQDTAGTVYGGTMTVNDDGSGVLTAQLKHKRYTGEASEGWAYSSWSAIQTYVFYAGDLIDSSHPSDNYNCIKYCNQVPITDYSGLRDNDVSGIAITGGSKSYPSIRIPKSLIADGTAAAFNAYLANNPLDIVYELATPLTYTFSNLEQLSTVYGINNIWATTGDVTVEYRADTKRYIDKKIAEIVNS